MVYTYSMFGYKFIETFDSVAILLVRLFNKLTGKLIRAGI